MELHWYLFDDGEDIEAYLLSLFPVITDETSEQEENDVEEEDPIETGETGEEKEYDEHKDSNIIINKYWKIILTYPEDYYDDDYSDED